MSDRWFWSSPEWAAYCREYGGGVTSNFGPHGNAVIDLAPSATMWTKVRKGHQAAIRKAERSVFVSDSPAFFDDYQALHEKDAGRKTRPQSTFDLMRSFLDDDDVAPVVSLRGADNRAEPLIPSCGVLFTALRDGVPLASAYFFRYRGGAYYASAAKDPDLDPRLGVAHLLVWRAMTILASTGYRWLDMGPWPPDDSEDPKVFSIAAFKRHFGASRKVWPYEEGTT